MTQPKVDLTEKEVTLHLLQESTFENGAFVGWGFSAEAVCLRPGGRGGRAKHDERRYGIGSYPSPVD